MSSTAKIRIRNQEICRLRTQGLTLDQVGREVGLTRERVRQILAKMGGPTMAVVRGVQAQLRLEMEQSGQLRIREDLAKHPGSSVNEIANRLLVDPGQIRRLLPADLRAQIIAESKPGSVKWDEASIRKALQRAATLEFPLTATGYQRLVDIGEVHGPSGPRLEQRFGGWTTACTFAGVESGQPMRSNYQSKWTEEDLLAFVRTYLRDPGSRGTYADYDRWRQESEIDDAPSGQTLRNRLGPWAAVKRRALTE